MEIRKVEGNRYHAFVKGHPDRTVFHSLMWHECMRGVFGTRFRYLGLFDGEELAGVCPVFVRRFALATISGCPVPRNATPRLHPLLNEGAGPPFLRALDRWIRSERIGHFQLCWPEADVAPPTGARAEPQLNMEIHLAPSLEENWNRMGRRVRNRIRHALRHGVRVHWMTDEAFLEAYARLQDSTYRQRQGIDANCPPGLYEEVFRRRGEIGARVLAATHEGRVISAVWLLFAHDRCYAWDGASDQVGRRLSGGHLVQWEAIRWCVRQGYSVYDLIGYAGRARAKEGIPRFKRSLGARPVGYALIYWQSPWYRLALSAYRLWRRMRDRPR